MPKDPAFLFYSQDFLTGTGLMTPRQRGYYITLLCYQHQNICLSYEDVMKIMGDDYESDWKGISKKFIKDENGNLYNERLRMEAEKRKRYCESRSNNKNSKKKNQTISFSYDLHMENENENENTVLEGGVGETKEIKNNHNGKKFTNYRTQGQDLYAERFREHANKKDQDGT